MYWIPFSKKKIRFFYLLLLLLFCIFLFFIIYFTYYRNKKEGFLGPDPTTGEYDIERINKNAVIPLHIYQTWSTKSLPPKMKRCVDKLKKMNPEFQHHLFDDADCREFIKNNYESNVLEAYDSLIPGAYKADLWRYCILYKNGGIYLDIKFVPVNGFKFISCIDKEYFVLDRPYEDFSVTIKDELKLLNRPDYYNKIENKISDVFWKNKKIGLYNALIIVKPNHPVLFECIQQIVKNVKNKEYGYNPLYPTGPGLLGEKYFRGDMSKINEIEMYNSLVGTYILTKKGKILEHYKEYRQEQNSSSLSHYYGLWINRKIYKELYERI
jgi:hypothetical protein